MRQVTLAALHATWLGHFKHRVIYGDTRMARLGVEACCDGDASLGTSVSLAQRKLEHVYRKAWLRFKDRNDPRLRWWIFTEHVRGR